MTGREPVEIKVNVVGQVEGALARLDLGEDTARTIWFLETPSADGSTPHPLFDAHVILRLRGRHDGSGESTIKLRPCLRDQLVEPWQHDGGADDLWDYKIEGDWSGSRQVLAASCQAPLPAGGLAAALRPSGDLAGLFVQPQWDFLGACGRLEAPVGTLRALGPIAATQWKKIPLAGFKVSAERWQVGDLDFLELSIRVAADGPDPATAQDAFETAVRRARIRIGDSGTSKTEMVLQSLSKADST